ncbi:unnamed protein product [Lepeophtheirus salmonis]|uniref:(salmon louse) hypothetical protein n=1 Tax=Lepeophtheirus salmonis TaxID=72036 RepID=A0A7R8D4X4_LEPSM|nr:unnamed protein product [Lepeophtheirus salmonis]CAF2999021.1 unnamed protein product [Lepeophtheirus salmonis]
MYYQESGTLHSRSHSMPESAYYTRVGARSRRNIVSMMSYDAPLHWRLREPLTVDCSVEYDLGAQARVPRDSAPLLIIHPAYVSRTPSVKEPRTPQNRSAPPVTRHASFVRRYPYEEDFRASMPDIRGAGHPGARACLKTRLEAVFADSGFPSSSAATLPMASTNSSYSQDGGGELNRTIRADSGIGSPTSCSSVTPESSLESSGSKKWRNGVSGLVTGFFCCSAVQPPPKNESWSQHNHHQQQTHHPDTNIMYQQHQRRQRLSLPSSSYTSSSSGSSGVQQHQQYPRRFHAPPSANNTMSSNGTIKDAYHVPKNHIHHRNLPRFHSQIPNVQVHIPFGLKPTPPYQCSSSSNTRELGVGTTCHRCRLSKFICGLS